MSEADETPTVATQIDSDHGAVLRAISDGAAEAEAEPIPALVEVVDLEAQLMQARRALFDPVRPSAAYAQLVEMSLRLADDADNEPAVWEDYAALRASF